MNIAADNQMKDMRSRTIARQLLEMRQVDYCAGEGVFQERSSRRCKPRNLKPIARKQSR